MTSIAGHSSRQAMGYRFETDFPPGYFGRPPHIHFKIFAPGHRSLTTQVYPKKGQSTITFNFVLIKV
jgi:protocatechuate 3,4-dioxygenase beta subunit